MASTNDLVLFLTERIQIAKVGGGTAYVRAEYTGLTDVKLKPVGGGTDLTGVEQGGNPGFYTFEGFVKLTLYKLFINGSEKGTYGGGTGRIEFTDDTLSGYATLAGENTWTNYNYFDMAVVFDHAAYINASSPLYTDYDHEDFNDTTLVFRKYVTDKIAEAVLTLNYTRTIIVCAGIADIAGKQYNTIQEAINYAVTQTPSSGSRWLILVVPGYYAENITYQAYVDVKGWGGMVYVYGTHTGINANTRLENYVLSYNPTANVTLANLIGRNLVIVGNDPEDTGFILTLNGGNIVYGINIYWQGATAATKIVSGGDNQLSGYSNKDIQDIQTNDRIAIQVIPNGDNLGYTF